MKKKNILAILLVLSILPFNRYMSDNGYGQHFYLKQDTPVWFHIPDQMGWTKGRTIILWGYYPMINYKYGVMEFNDVVWEIGYE